MFRKSNDSYQLYIFACGIGILILMSVVFFSVSGKIFDWENKNIIPEEVVKPETEVLPEVRKNVLPTIQKKLDSLQLVNIQEIDSDFLVDLKYASADNFTGIVLYDSLHAAYLQPDVALMLAEAHRYLKSLYPDLRLLVYDAVRPLSVQRMMWERVKDTPYHRYVAHPDRFSLHNYGASVDLTLAGKDGRPLDMGTPFDHFGRAAGISDEQGLLKQGLLNREQIQNRQLLRKVMLHAGFSSISGEWWHFNACSLQEAKRRYTIVDW